MIQRDMITDEGEWSKFRQFYKAYKNTMYCVAHGIAKHEQDAEDIVAESMLRVIRILDKIDGESIGSPRCRNLAITIAKNIALDDQKRKNRELETASEEAIIHHSIVQSTEELYFDIENCRELVEHIKNLEDKYKQVLQLKVLHQLSSKEIAEILNITEGNVNMRFLRAKKILKEKMEERDRDE